MRLDRYVSKSLQITRKEAKELIRSGRVKVNGEVIRSPEYKVKEHDRVEVEGKELKPKERVYILLYKPRGYLSTTERESFHPSFLNLLEERFGGRKLFAAGRLDVDAEGLLLVTDDGQLAHRLTHPKWKVEKEYIVELDRDFKEEDLERLKGVVVEGKPVFIVKAEKLGNRKLRVVLTEGRYRIVKRLFKAIGYNVVRLIRRRLGSLTLPEEFEPGDFRELSEEEVRSLKKLVRFS